LVAPQAAKRPDVEAFVQWLIAQAKDDEAKDLADSARRRTARSPRRKP